MMFWNYDPYPRMWQKGSSCPGFQTLGSDSLSCPSYRFEIGLTRQA